MTLGIDEMEKLLEEVFDKVKQELFLANRQGKLDEALEKYGVAKKPEKYIDRNAKILIIGGSEVSEDDIRKLAKAFRIKSDLECELDYKKIQKFNFNKLEYNSNYSCVLVGPMPHSVHGKEGYGSIISRMESEQEKFPKIYRLSNANELKITRSTLKEAFKKIC